MSRDNYSTGNHSECPDCGKRRYLTRKDAKRAIKRFDPTMASYKCGQFFHVGHLPRAVIAGRLARSDIARRGGTGGSQVIAPVHFPADFVPPSTSPLPPPAS